MEWVNETGIKDFSSYYGFTYCIQYTNGNIYYGRKNFVSITSRPPLKGFKRKRKILKETNWRTYEGSSDKTKCLVIQKKTILELAKTKGRLTYLENKLLYEKNAIIDINCRNDCISGKIWYKTIGQEPIKWSVNV